MNEPKADDGATVPCISLLGKFRITGGKGFQVTFENGWTVSVQFGPGNYADNYNMRIGAEDTEAGRIGSRTAECALISPEGALVHRDAWGDSVSNRSTPAEVLALMVEAAGMPNAKVGGAGTASAELPGSAA